MARTSNQPLRAVFSTYAYINISDRKSLFNTWALPVTQPYYDKLLEYGFTPARIAPHGTPCILSRDTIAIGWTFVVRDCFYDALGMKYIDRLVNGTRQSVLVQREMLSFSTGDTLHAAAINRDLIVQVISSAGSTSGRAVLRIQFFLSNETFDEYRGRDDFHCTQEELVRLLKTGIFRPLNVSEDISIHNLFPELDRAITAPLEESKLLHKKAVAP